MHSGKDEPELEILLAQQAQLAAYLNDMKLRSVDDWAEEELARAGPMGIHGCGGTTARGMDRAL